HTYFFHNTVYSWVYKDAHRRQPLPVPELLKRSQDTRLIILGDASMAPEELIYPGGSLWYGDEESETSLRWLERLRDRFRHAVWLNPIPKELWPDTYGRTTIRKIGEVFPMEDLTLGGIKRAVARLTRG
ncbi:MAG TPA: VWA containing CoxE family protein, partial [Thermoanaerobaculia bacterium]